MCIAFRFRTLWYADLHVYNVQQHNLREMGGTEQLCPVRRTLSPTRLQEGVNEFVVNFANNVLYIVAACKTNFTMKLLVYVAPNFWRLPI